MSLRIYNTLSRQKEPFTPLVPGKVGMYVCGVTPYAPPHVGHGRSALVFDVIRRYLTFRGYRVQLVQNFTDVEDKIIARAAQTGTPWQDLVETQIKTHDEDMQWLGIESPNAAPRATQHIETVAGKPYRMISLIERLIGAGVAYTVDGDVYFEVRRYPPYGRLSGRALDDLRSGARVEVDERKRDSLDFALWKASKPGEPAWPSPWGPGRPGWHIECSAMSMEYLGEQFDLHGGGQDLIFPHHENEIAQSEAATGTTPFARYWLHNGLVNVGAEKMSKSLGNMLNMTELRKMVELRKYHREAVRLYLLGTHYRSPLEFWGPRVDEANQARGRLAMGVAFQVAGEAGIPGEERGWDQLTLGLVDELVGKLADDTLRGEVSTCAGRFVEAMDDDFNTPAALGTLFDLSRAVNRYRDGGLAGGRVTCYRHAAGVLLALGRVLGLFWWHVDPFEFTGQEESVDQEQVERLLAERKEARRLRNWSRADEIRAQLDALGLLIEDTPTGPKLRWKRSAIGP